ncbi:chromatin remodeling complex subunit [Niveomyces insectorum RCEF 264]|uniref:Chromatin remodeling complex subunit n=1 Tax=Niveomyces insectorum RCEF 264 TaxID=1081102 RepID=A0A167RH17_9HYPO|nr:chromatin remodeling complex subunit [Niveomyces insectorum RCEF 264]
MVGKVSERVLLREGLERTDNGMKQTSWPEVTPINQKNYYTEYMKRDDQILALRVQNEANRDRLVQNAKDRDRALNQSRGEIPLPLAEPQQGDFPLNMPTDGMDISKIIVIHPGSQYLRIGFSTDVLPKTVPMCLASKFPRTESEEYDALPRRQFEAQKVDQQYGEEWSKKYKKMSEDLKLDMRLNKRKVLPNSKELVVNYNRRTEPELIATHNDPLQVEWTDVNALPEVPVDVEAAVVAPEDEEAVGGGEQNGEEQNGDGHHGHENGAANDAAKSVVLKTTSAPAPPSTFFGSEAQRIPDDSVPKFRLRWPMQLGWLNEDDYASVSSLYSDFEAVVTHAIQNELGLKKVSACRQYSCVFVIPDLYDKAYVEQILRLCMNGLEFNKVCFIQESYAATCGAGYSQGCVVDVGAQKTSVACVEDGLVVEDSRINLKYGGFDVTETFVKMLLYDHFPYQEINLRRRYDFLLAEELKQKHCTMNQADISVQLYQFHLRAPNQPTRKYQFKTYDEVILSAMGFYDPTVFDNSTKLRGRRKLIDRTYNAYDVDVPDDPVSAAQVAILALDRPSVLPSAAPNGFGGGGGGTPGPHEVSTPSKDRTQPFNFFARGLNDLNGTPSTSKAPSPAPPDGVSTPPVPPPPFVFGAGREGTGAASPAPSGRNGGTPAPSGPATSQSQSQSGTAAAAAASSQPPNGVGLYGLDPLFHRTAKDIAIERDSVLPVAPLDIAIMTSIQNAAKGDERKLKDYLGSVMVVGGGAKIPHFTTYLEERLKARRPDLLDRILVSRSARDMDEQVVVWKGASVFAKLTTNDSWISPYEYEFLGPRILHHKVLWQW